MWSDQKSVLLSQIGVLFFAGVLLVVAFSAPWLVRWLIDFSRADLQGTERFFFATIYIGFVPAAVLLYSLFRLLRRVAAKQMFLPENVKHLRHISWSCFLGAAVSLLSTLYYLPWLLVALPAVFAGLIVRVVRNVVALGVELQNEADHTI